MLLRITDDIVVNTECVVYIAKTENIASLNINNEEATLRIMTTNGQLRFDCSADRAEEIINDIVVAQERK